VLFGNPERATPQISPDGKRLAWLAPDKKNVLQVWVKTIGKDDDKIITADKKRGIRRYLWAHDNKTLLYMQDQDGDENWHVYGVDPQSGNVRDYTPFAGVRADIAATHMDLPDQILVQMNLRKRELMDIYRVTLSTGAVVLDTENPGDVAGFEADTRLQVRAAQVATPDGGTEIRVRPNAKAPWKSWLKVGPEEILNLVGFTKDGNGITLVSSIGSDTARVVERNIATGKERVIAASPEVDAEPGGIEVHPRTNAVRAVAFSPGRTRWTVTDPAVKDDFAAIEKLYEGDFRIINGDAKDQTWLVAFTADKGPTRYFSYDRAAKKGTFLFTNQPKLEGLKLSEMKPIVIKSRDGMDLNAYITLPQGAALGTPLVLLVHGGPWARDHWGYNGTVQWLANRGYAVLQVNFRGSTGYGKKFLAASFKQWGKTMHNDLLDAVTWATKQGFDAKRVAIMGDSYGGYAALVGATYTPETFACAVDIVGPSNLATLIATAPPYWKPLRSLFNVRVGNIDDPADRELLKAASPLYKADKIVKPLLIGQGANDPRVKQAESEQIVAAIKKNNGKVTYVLYSDEGHGFARPENRLDFFARTEVFLKDCLGGKVEPMKGDKHPGSTAVVQVIGPQKTTAAPAAAPAAPVAQPAQQRK
jgi:dipeptidyl aminopeptidase/acylaminoacyl peptidase